MTDRFAEQFAAAWAQPTPESLVALLDPQVVLKQPHRAPVIGRDAALAEFRNLFAWLPGMHGVVDRAVAEGEWVFIEWRMQVPLRRRMISIPAVDRFRVRNGLGVERIVYFDQMTLIRALARHPWLWPGYLRYLARTRR